jgi:(+)-trans-carveol dehydrogenase
MSVSQINDTPMMMNDATKQPFLPGDLLPSEEQFAEVFQSINALPIRWVEPVDIANALLFLSSNEGCYIRGVARAIDAGIVTK